MVMGVFFHLLMFSSITVSDKAVTKSGSFHYASHFQIVSRKQYVGWYQVATRAVLEFNLIHKIT